MEDKSIPQLLLSLSSKDKEILRLATNALYFDDGSDYCSALWEIVNEISNSKIEDCNSELFSLLND